MSARDAVIVSTARTPIGRAYKGAFNATPGATLGALSLAPAIERAGIEAAHDWAHRYADGRWLALGGGGYAVVDVVPRLWAHLTAVAAHAPVDPATPVPESWRQTVYALTRESGPWRMTDGRTPKWLDWEAGYDPADPVDQAVLATRRAAFPQRGLLP